MDKATLLDQLRNETFCRLMPSKVHGIGIIAIKLIPKGTDPFSNSPDVSLIPISSEEVNALEPAIRDFVKAFCVKEGDNYMVPEVGLTGMDISYFINHSSEPNVEAIKQNGDVVFRTTRDIQPGEELLSNYQTYSDDNIKDLI